MAADTAHHHPLTALGDWRLSQPSTSPLRAPACVRDARAPLIVSFQLRLPLFVKLLLDLRAGGTGACPLVSAGLSMSSPRWLDDFHVSSHNLFRCCTATLPHHISVMSTKWRGSPKRHHTGLRGVETWGSQYTYIPHSAFNCPFIVPPAVFTVRMHVDAQPLFPPHPCGRY